ncbi:hypothetical protein [Microbacterium sp. MMO-10]|uniref:hypothetical protein n=1 Tax=Microbacterium sp. MMO-10 TaxID=3081272 RepID=UPI00301A6638
MKNSTSWTASLPTEEKARLLEESAEIFSSCMTAGRYDAFFDLLEDWMNTARIHSDLTLVSALSGDIEDPTGQYVV